MDNFSFRPADINDISTILDLEKNCFNNLDYFKINQIKHLVKNKNTVISDILLYLNQIIGWAVFLTRKNSKLIRLYSLCILPEMRGKGIAYSYLIQKFEIFKNRYKGVTLEVRISNNNAINLYQKLGFKINRILEKYYPDGENGYKMIKNF